MSSAPASETSSHLRIDFYMTVSEQANLADSLPIAMLLAIAWEPGSSLDLNVSLRA
jgi:hypothetical protein